MRWVKYFLGDGLSDPSPVKGRFRSFLLFMLCMLGNNCAVDDGALGADVVESVVFGGVEGAGPGAEEGVGAFVSSSSLL